MTLTVGYPGPPGSHSGAAASVLEVGAGRFDPREASRLGAGVELAELAAVPSA